MEAESSLRGGQGGSITRAVFTGILNSCPGSAGCLEAPIAFHWLPHLGYSSSSTECYKP